MELRQKRRFTGQLWLIHSGAAFATQINLYRSLQTKGYWVGYNRINK